MFSLSPPRTLCCLLHGSTAFPCLVRPPRPNLFHWGSSGHVFCELFLFCGRSWRRFDFGCWVVVAGQIGSGGRGRYHRASSRDGDSGRMVLMVVGGMVRRQVRGERSSRGSVRVGVPRCCCAAAARFGGIVDKAGRPPGLPKICYHCYSHGIG